MLNKLYSILIKLVIFFSIWASYIGSWGKGVFQFPLGAVLRDSLIFILLLTSVFRILSKRQVSRKVFTLVTYWAIVFMLMLFLLQFAPDLNTGLNGIRIYIVYPATFIVLYALENSGIKILENRNSFISFFLFNIFIISIIGILDVMTLGEFPKLLGYDPDFAGGNFSLITNYEDRIRATGGFADALNYGYLLALGILVAFHFLLLNRNRVENILLITTVIIASIATVLTLTRGAILIIVVIIMYYLIHKKSFSTLLLLAVVVICFFIYNPQLIEVLVGRFTDSNVNSAGSSQGRIEMAMSSIESLFENPMGLGLGSQGSANRFSARDMRVNSDNFFFWIMLELGVLASIVFMSYLLKQFSLARKLTNGFNIYWLFVVSFLISSMLSSAPTSSIYSINFWLMIFLCRPYKGISDDKNYQLVAKPIIYNAS